ncbi:AraC family transcriptional regulator [Methylobacterium terrae]|uniref:AraC family transcriptional regulator n=2 Tax=Methylobacterium terrae TaxID=2202827 RepID=A0A2U8WUV7_9HYPH|nr:AraC family transcriptional regulator [Methylobacterium terrae]
MGTSPEEVCRNAAIDLSALYETDDVSFASLGHLMAAAAGRIGCGHLGLLVGQRTDLLSFGPLGTLIRHSRTIDDALQALGTHHVLPGRGAAIELSTGGLVATVTCAPCDPEAAGIAYHCECALGALTGVMRSLCGVAWCPDEVWLPRPAPADPSPYTGFFRAPVRFSQEIAALVFPARLLGRPIPGADPVLRAAAEQRIRSAKAAIPVDLGREVRRRVRSRATRSRIDRDEIAQALTLNPRTLCRRLRAEGPPFRSITNQTRLGIAKQLLADTTMGLAEISAALEFSEPAAFTHAFRRWTGTAPGAWRQDHQRRDHQRQDHQRRDHRPHDRRAECHR